MPNNEHLTMAPGCQLPQGWSAVDEAQFLPGQEMDHVALTMSVVAERQNVDEGQLS